MISAATRAAENSFHATDRPPGSGRRRGHRDPRVAGLARLRTAVGRPRARRGNPQRARGPRAPPRPQAAVHRQHALRQHHRRRTSRRPSPAATRSSAASRASSAGTPWRWSSRPTRPSDGIGGHISTFASSATLYEVGLQPLLPGQGPRAGRRLRLLPGPRLARHVRARLPRRPALAAAARELPPRAEARRRPVVVPAPVADARLLGSADGVDGPRPDHVDLPGALHALPGGSRPQAAHRPEGVGVPRRRRDRRARVARRHHARLAREARQPDLRHQLQPAAPRRPGPRQRQDHPGARGDLPRRRLERHQGALGQRVGRAARARPRRPAAQARRRDRRRRVPEVLGDAGRLHPPAVLRRRPAAAEDGRAPVRRPAEEDARRRPRSREGVPRLQGGRPSTRASRPSSSPARSRATASARAARARTSRTSRRR